MTNSICRIFGHKSPYFFIYCKLGESFHYKKSYCRRCHKNIGEYEGLSQRYWSAFGDHWIWADIDNKPVDLETNCNNPRWLVPLVYNPNDFQGKSYVALEDGILEGSNLAHHVKKKLYEHYVKNGRNEQTMVYHG